MARAILPARNATHDAMVDARNVGHSWTDINDYLAGKKQDALNAGYNDDEIQGYLGLGDPNDLNSRLSQMMQQQYANANAQDAGSGASGG
jgi:hypothetical protein